MEYRQTFDQRIEATQQSLKALLERAGGSPEQRAVVTEALEALSTSLEELYAAGEELHQQNEELYAARQMLDEERQKYHELFEFAPDGYLLTDAAGTIREANKAAAELLHVSQDYLVGKPLEVYVARQDYEAFHSQLASLAQGGQAHAERVVDWELRLRPRGTRLLPVSVAVAVARDRRGQAVGLRWQMRDITRRKQGEAALRDARDELEIRVQERTAELARANAALQVEVAEHRRAAEEAESQARFPAENLNPVLRLSREGALMYANEASAPLLAEWDCAPGGLVPPFWRDQVAEVLTSQTAKTVDVPCGERVYSFFVVPIGPAGYVNLYGRDITLRKRAEERLQFQNEELQAQTEELEAQAEELRAQADELHAQALDLAEERARLQAIIDSVPEAILVADERGQLVLANPAADRLFAAPVTGAASLKRYAEVTRYDQDHAPIDPQRLPLFRAAVHGEAHRNMPVALLWPDGQWRDVLASAVPIRDERGRTYGAVSVYQDISERTRAESQRDAMLEQVKVALGEKEVLIREIYHRVKNNVQALIYLMDMQADYISDDGTRQMLRELQERARTMALVHEKLYQSQNLAQIDFGDYLHDLVNNLSRAFGDGRAIAWHVNVENVLLGVDIAIPCGLIVNELLTNALKYAFPPGGDHPCLEQGETECEIRVDFRADGDQLTLTVSDNGVGLPSGIDRNTPHSLGLQLINVLAEHQLGGQVEVDAQAGTTFKITFTERKK